MLSSFAIFCATLLSIHFASAFEICDSSGHCYRDPSLTSAAAEEPTPIANEVKSTTVVTENGGTTGSTPTATLTPEQAASQAAAMKCQSPYPRIPLTAQQMTVCQQGLQRLAGKEYERLKQIAEKQNQNQQQQQPPPMGQQPGSNGNGQQSQNNNNNEKKDDSSEPQRAPAQASSAQADSSDQLGSSACEQSLKRFVSQCEQERQSANRTCDAQQNEHALAANQYISNSANGGSGTTNQRLGQQAGGMAAGSLSLKAYGSDCRENHQICQSKCEKHAEAARKQAQQSCRKPEDKRNADKVIAMIKQKSEQCSSLEEKAVAAENQGQEFEKGSNQAAKNQGGSAGDMTGTMASMMGLMARANQEQQRQQTPSVDPGVLNPCQDPTVMMQVPQMCTCAPQNLSEQACMNSLPGNTSPLMGGYSGQETTTRAPTSTPEETRVLPAEYSGEISPP